MAAPSTADWTRINFAVDPARWPDFDALAGRLVNSCARKLNITVDNEEVDFLLWDVLDAAHVYSDPGVAPDAEHLCLAALAIEGVASELPTANWDPLIERAIAILAGPSPILRVVVHPEDMRIGRRRANLYKVHGCAQAACDDPAKYRPLLVARENQINRWASNNVVVGGTLIQLIITKSTLMLGLSAQDSNIHAFHFEAEGEVSGHDLFTLRVAQTTLVGHRIMDTGRVRQFRSQEHLNRHVVAAQIRLPYLACRRRRLR